MADITTSVLKPKNAVTKGHYGYIRYRRRMNLLKALLLLAGLIGIVIIGYVMTQSMKNWLSIFACLTSIPMALTLVPFFAMLKFKQRPEEEYNLVKSLTGNGVLDVEILIPDKDGLNFTIDYAYVHETGIYCFSSDPKIDTKHVEEYIRNYLRLSSCDCELTVYKEMETYLKRLETLSPSDRETATEKMLEQEGVLRAIIY